MTVLKLAVVPGDGIGKEVVPEGLRVLEAALAGTGVEVEQNCFDLGADYWRRTGQALLEEDLEAIKAHDAVLLGAVGDPTVPSGLLERGLLLRLRFALDHAVNLRPFRLLPGACSPLADPGEIDFVVVREGTEGLYCGAGGAVRRHTAQEVATEVSVNTAYGVERVVRYAFELASKRRGHLTLVHKDNVLVHAGGLWRRTVEEVGRQYPMVRSDYCHVDAATIYLVTDPGRFDVIVTDNLFGDIITDEAGAITGGVGMAASANLNLDRRLPSMFEPVHGSAPDIAGKGLADPTGTISAVAMLLEHLGHGGPAARVRAAVDADVTARARAAHASAPLERSTREVGEAVAALVRPAGG